MHDPGSAATRSNESTLSNDAGVCDDLPGICDELQGPALRIELRGVVQQARAQRTSKR
jgi:hypothetical protein